jgi:hypothetical protein
MEIMPLPTKREDLEALGYVYDNDARCRGCDAHIEWWITPKGKKMPFSVKEVKRDPDVFFSPSVQIERVPHFSDCPTAADWRKSKS